MSDNENASTSTSTSTSASASASVTSQRRAPTDYAHQVLERLTALFGAGDPDDLIPLHAPEIGAQESAHVQACLDSTFVSTVGKDVDGFERMLEAATGSPHAIAVCNGTAALHTALRLVGVSRDDEVLMPALTFVATANAVAYQGAIPHFVESDAARLAVDPKRLESYLASITERRQTDGALINRQTGRRIAALVVVHIFGHPADMAALQSVADQYGLPIVEDAAESLGSSIGTRHTGRFGRIAAMSFNGNKIITTGGGGALLVEDPELARRAKHLTTTARIPAGWDFVHDEVGYNYRMPNLNAALGRAQLERLPDFIARKRTLATRYIEQFADMDGADIITEPAGTQSNYWLVALKTPDRTYRDAVLKVTNDAGFMTRPCWTLMHNLPMFKDCPRDDLRVSEACIDQIVNLPSSPNLADRKA